MAPPPKLDHVLLAALGLAGTAACHPCLSIRPCLSPVETDEPGDTDDTDVGPCLSLPPDTDTDAGETDTDTEPGETDSDTDAGEGATAGARDEVLDRLERAGVLPTDLVARLRRLRERTV